MKTINDIRTNLNNTIDLAGEMENDRYNQLIEQGYLPKPGMSFKTLLTLSLAILFAIVVCFTHYSQTNAYEGNLSIQDKIRLERLETCQKAYKDSGINKQFIHNQIPAVRCATYMTLIYAYESNFGKSYKCTTKNNCHGMKGNGRDHPAGFITFKSYQEGREWFSNRYWKFHYKKNIRTFVYNWSMTDRKTYINFVSSKYWNIYNELETLYLTN